MYEFDGEDFTGQKASATSPPNLPYISPHLPYTSPIPPYISLQAAPADLARLLLDPRRLDAACAEGEI